MQALTSHASSNFCGARMAVHTNLDLGEWASICHTEEDAVTLSYLTFGFPVGYEGSVPTPSLANHSSARSHSHDFAAYISKELEEGAMLGPFDRPPFHPWTQTRPKKDSEARCIIMDLSWPLPSGISVNRCTPRDCFLSEPQKISWEFVCTDQANRQRLLLICNRCCQGLPAAAPGSWPLAPHLFPV